MYLNIVFTDGTQERAFCCNGVYWVHESVLIVAQDLSGKQTLNYPLANIKKFWLE